MASEQTKALKNTLLFYQNPRPISEFTFYSLDPDKALKRLGSTARIKCSFDYIGAPVQIKHLPSGKVLALSRLAVKKSQTQVLWINLTFWDKLAHVAFEHVQKGHQIYVCGCLVSDTVENDDGKQRTYYKIVVQKLNFIYRGLSSVSLYNEGSNSVTSEKKNYAANSIGSAEELWQAFFVNPMEWWDNMKNKRSPNYPDFKHKDTGEALWSQLAILDSRMESFHEQNSSTHINFMPADSS
ncbi:hypothetical protein Pfo_006376 [Paulownia fortunei]|nr:hypothetical protein Pfo_006376 [Paulownia fortunei]